MSNTNRFSRKYYCNSRESRKSREEVQMWYLWRWCVSQTSKKVIHTKKFAIFVYLKPDRLWLRRKVASEIFARWKNSYFSLISQNLPKFRRQTSRNRNFTTANPMYSRLTIYTKKHLFEMYILVHWTMSMSISMSKLQLHTACMHASCPCSLSMLLIHAAYPCCMSMLHFGCMSIVHAAYPSLFSYPCCMSTLHVHAACPSSISLSLLSFVTYIHLFILTLSFSTSVSDTCAIVQSCSHNNDKFSSVSDVITEYVMTLLSSRVPEWIIYTYGTRGRWPRPPPRPSPPPTGRRKKTWI
jgi:hypothetical protein